MEKSIHTTCVEELFEAVLTLQNVQEYMEFFEDVCTVKEVQSIAQRFAVAKMLRAGSTYAEVAAKTGASTATISRVNRSMTYGNGSYDKIFERLQNSKSDA